MNDGKRRSRFLSNTIALVVQMVLATLITLVQVKILSNFLAREDFGRFASLRGFSLLIAMLAANGLPQLLVRFIPVHEARGDRGRALGLSVACLGGTALLLTLLCGIVYAARGHMLAYLGAVSDELMLWFVVTTVAVAFKQVVYGGFNGLRRLTAQVAVELVSLSAVLAWIVVARDALTLTLLFRILGSVNAIAVAVAVPVYLWMVARAHAQEGSVDSGQGYGSYLVWATGISLVALAFTDVDRYLLAHVLSLEMLALFHIGARVARLGHRLLGMPNLAFQPEITRISAEGREDEILDVTRVFLKFNVTAAVLIAAALVLFSREIIIIVASTEYVGAVPLMMILAATLPLTTMTAPITTVMKALDQIHAALLVDLVWALLYVGLILLLSPAMGLVGVGLATAGAALAQLTTAVLTSRLQIGGGSIVAVAAKLVASAVAAWWPVVIAGFVATAAVPAITLKLGLFLVGMVAYHWLIRRLRVFALPEREALTQILHSRRMGALARLV